MLGKTAGGFFSLAITLGILTTVFSVLCMVYGKAGGFSVNAADLIFAACVYILPNMLMIVSVYAITALIFKNPLPTTLQDYILSGSNFVHVCDCSNRNGGILECISYIFCAIEQMSSFRRAYSHNMKEKRLRK